MENYSRAKQVTDDNIVGCMRMACRITNAADTHSYYFSTATMLCERTSSLCLHLHWLPC